MRSLTRSPIVLFVCYRKCWNICWNIWNICE